MRTERKSFLIYKNWADAINALPEEYQLEAYKALVSYGVSGEIPKDTSQIVGAILISFSVGMENNISSYEKRVANGKKGGNPNFQKGKPNPYYAKKSHEGSSEELVKNGKSMIKESCGESQEREIQSETLREKDIEELGEFFDEYIKIFDGNLDDFNEEETNKKDNRNITEDNLNENDNDNENENENDNDNANYPPLVSENTGSRSDRVLFYLDCLSDKLGNIFSKKNLDFDENVYHYYKDLFNKMSFEKTLKLGNMSLEVDDGIKEFLDIFRRSDEEILKLLYECYDAIFVKKDVKNRFKYAVSVIYNRMKGL